MLAAKREASAQQDALARERQRTAVEIALDEERQLLEGCLVDAQTERETERCRADLAESELAKLRLRVGRKRRLVRSAVRHSVSRVRASTEQLMRLAAQLKSAPANWMRRK